jgi:hypothetical protein
MNPDQLITAHQILTHEEESRVECVNYIYSESGLSTQISDPDVALQSLLIFVGALISEGDLVGASLFLWGSTVFDARPKSVKRIWDALDVYPKLLCMGAGVQGKTYTPTVKFFLRWLEDPANTAIKVVSTTAGHARSNAFAGFKRLHTEAAIPLPGILRYDFIGLNTDARYSSIEQVAIKPGEDGRAALRGFHPIPRRVPHPKFGHLSVVILMLDEADDVPSGAYTGVDNIVSGQTEQGNVQVYAATNPIKPSSEFARRAMPMRGWESVDEDHTYEWEGHEGWHVIRLDARQSENYKERREVFRGLMTYEAAKGYEAKGVNHPDYQTFVLGMYPKQSSMYYIVPPYLLDDVVGTYHFVRAPYDIGVEDPAFAEGGDKAIFTSARYGLVDGWTDRDGKFHEMPRRWCIQLDQQFEMPKKNTLEMGEDVIALCRKLHIRPEWFGGDATGMGHGLFDYLLKRFGEVLAVQWGEASTETKILDEDTEIASERYDGLVTEMWFAFARWVEFGYLKISPSVQTRELFHELSTRLYRQTGKTKSRASSKGEYKSVNSGRSPDFADSAIMVVHLVRMRGQDRAAMLPEHQEFKEPQAVDIFSPFDEFRRKGTGVSDLFQPDFLDFDKLNE